MPSERRRQTGVDMRLNNKFTRTLSNDYVTSVHRLQRWPNFGLTPRDCWNPSGGAQ